MFSGGVNVDPTKYGLVETLESPGHNVTGVYQTGYLRETLGCLKKLAPGISTLVVLSDDSSTGRAKAKKIESLAVEGRLGLKLTASIVTDSFSEWKAEILRFRDKTDSFFIFNHNTLKDPSGKAVDPLEASAWYLKNVKKPDCTDEKQFVEEGVLIAVDDSGFKQGYEAVKIAHQILFEKKDPAVIPVVAPYRGAVMVNRQRAGMLGVDLSSQAFIEEYVDKSLALEKYPSPQ
ncbi:MAG: ABC transporter substrate binding protein [Candidatus Omnitrophota bacterium]